MNVLVTGAAGFIGASLSKRLLERGDTVTGIDNLNDYYDVNLKRDRLKRLHHYVNFTLSHTDIADREAISSIFSGQRFNTVVNLAAQAGASRSWDGPALITPTTATMART